MKYLILILFFSQVAGAQVFNPNKNVCESMFTRIQAIHFDADTLSVLEMDKKEKELNVEKLLFSFYEYNPKGNFADIPFTSTLNNTKKHWAKEELISASGQIEYRSNDLSAKEPTFENIPFEFYTQEKSLDMTRFPREKYERITEVDTQFGELFLLLFRMTMNDTYNCNCVFHNDTKKDPYASTFICKYSSPEQEEALESKIQKYKIRQIEKESRKSRIVF